ncbi:hypothetical protein, partial [Cryobacterium sp. MLB-32]|uniref:hypothetical protein n=2 Tax=Cryobacterium sp. MLB-32 TaxID=1529318 RepID=UPI001E50CDFA
LVNDMKKSDMLAGRTAEQWSGPVRFLARILFSTGVISGALYFVTGSTAETVPLWLYVIFGVTIVIFVVAFLVYCAFALKAHREAKAGYTTTGGLYPKVPQVDSLTGEVLREVGEALMSDGPERRKRLK